MAEAPPAAKRKILQVLPKERGYLRSRKRGNHVRSRFVESSQFRQKFGLLPKSAGAARLRGAVSGRGGKERGLRPEGSPRAVDIRGDAAVVGARGVQEPESLERVPVLRGRAQDGRQGQ